MDKGRLPVFKVREVTHCITNSQESNFSSCYKTDKETKSFWWFKV